MADEPLVSSAAGFSWMPGGMGAALDHFIASWLADAMMALSAAAKRNCRKKGVSISIASTGMHSSQLIIKDAKPSGPFTLEQWAFGIKVSVPAGGFKPLNSADSFPISKPWGEQVFRRRTYNKHSGGDIQVAGSGFVLQAINETFTQDRLDVLGKGSAGLLAAAIAQYLKMKAASSGAINIQIGATL